MQTFLVSSDFDRNAWWLDNKRLNKQLLEGRQILAANAGMTKGWVNHPAARMWKNNTYTLFSYLFSVKNELNRRGIAWEKNWTAIVDIVGSVPVYNVPDPAWFSDLVTLDKVITSHRANLYLKDPDFYVDFKIDAKAFAENPDYFTCCDRCSYYWPTHVLDAHPAK